MAEQELWSVSRLVILFAVFSIEPLYVVYWGLSILNPSSSALTLSKSFLVDSTELISILREHLRQKCVICCRASVPMHKENDSFPLLTNLHGVAIILDMGPIRLHFNGVYSGGRGPIKAFVIDKLILVFPFFKRNLLPIFVLNKLALHIPCDFAHYNPVSIVCLSIIPTSLNLLIFFIFQR